MKKNFLLSTLLFAGLVFGASSVQAAPHGPNGPHGGHGGGHRPPAHMHRPPAHNHVIHHPPRHHHVRHYGGYYSPYYCNCCFPLSFGFSTGRYYYPMRHHGNFGAHLHISI